jgi:hypothetical protein
VGGAVVLGSGTAFDASSYTHTVAGDWTNNGATFTAGSSTVQFVRTSGTQTLSGGGETFHILQFGGAALKTITGASLGAARVDVLGTTGTVTNNVTTFTVTNIAGVSFTVASGATFIQGTGGLSMTGGDFDNEGTVTNNGTITVN